MMGLAVWAVLESNLACLVPKTQAERATMTTSSVLAVMAVLVMTATRLNSTPLFRLPTS